MLRDVKTNELYSLFIAGHNDLGFNVAIRFTGILHAGPSACMEGKPIEVVKWSKIKNMKCAEAVNSNHQP